MRCDAKTEAYEMVEVFGIPMLFTCLRVDRKTVPDGLFMYEVRHDDDGHGDPVEIGLAIGVNHWGTLLSNRPIELEPSKLTDNAYREVEPKDWNYEGYEVTIEDYVTEYGVEK